MLGLGFRVEGFWAFEYIVPLKWIEYGVYNIPEAIFYLLKGDYRVWEVSGVRNPRSIRYSARFEASTYRG